MSVYPFLLMIHIGLGTIALATYWTAALSRKGSPVHRAAGKIYLLAMTALLTVAVPMACFVVSKYPVIGAFLFYLLVITGTAVWSSWRAIRDKRDWARYTGRTYRALMWLNLASGLAIAAIGLLFATRMQFVIVAFSLIGIAISVQMWRFSRRPPEDPRWWMREHMEAMLGNGVATHIAFLGIGLPKLLPMIAGPMLQNLAWLGPLGVAMLAGVWLKRKYLPRRMPAMAARQRGPAA